MFNRVTNLVTEFPDEFLTMKNKRIVLPQTLYKLRLDCANNYSDIYAPDEEYMYSFEEVVNDNVQKINMSIYK